jgi:hypothetical protein
MKFFLLTTLVCFVANFLNAQCIWTGAIDNNWKNVGNWSCGNVPTANDDVIISSGNPVIWRTSKMQKLHKKRLLKQPHHDRKCHRFTD